MSMKFDLDVNQCHKADNKGEKYWRKRQSVGAQTHLRRLPIHDSTLDGNYSLAANDCRKTTGRLKPLVKKITPARVIVAACRKIALPCKTWRTFKPDLVSAFQFGYFPALWGDFPEASILKFQLFQSSQWVLLSNRNWWNTQNGTVCWRARHSSFCDI